MDSFWVEVEGRPARQVTFAEGASLVDLPKALGGGGLEFKLKDSSYTTFLGKLSLAALRAVSSQDGQSQATPFQTRFVQAQGPPSLSCSIVCSSTLLLAG